MPNDLLAAFLIGLFGSTHCLAMCGGIAIALNLAPEKALRPLPVAAAYNLGRVLSYVAIGLLLGSAVGLATDNAPRMMPLLRIVAALLLVLMGLQVAGWLGWIAFVERIGKPVWAQLRPLAARLLSIDSYGRAICAGAVWGWLPCGLVYSTLAWAVTTDSSAGAAVLMGAFGLGTLPSMFLAALGGGALRTWLAKRPVRVVAGTLLIATGAWTASQPLMHLFGSGGGAHGSMQSIEMEAGHSH